MQPVHKFLLPREFLQAAASWLTDVLEQLLGPDELWADLLQLLMAKVLEGICLEDEV